MKKDDSKETNKTKYEKPVLTKYQKLTVILAQGSHHTE